jgi:hypothetical protein
MLMFRRWSPVVLSCLALSLSAVTVRSQSEGDVATSLYVLDFDGNGIALTSAAGGVEFDVDGTGNGVRVGWTAAGSDDAFLAMDVNKNGSIDSARELISTRTSLPDGVVIRSANEVFNHLQGLGRPVPGRRLPPGSASFDAADAAFTSVLVWVDRNHDGRSQPSELQSLAAARIKSIYGGFQRSRAVDAHGNQTLLTGIFWIEQRGVDFQRPLAIVRLAR